MGDVPSAKIKFTSFRHLSPILSDKSARKSNSNTSVARAHTNTFVAAAKYHYAWSHPIACPSSPRSHYLKNQLRKINQCILVYKKPSCQNLVQRELILRQKGEDRAS
ncbi:hypothetical protein OROMI_020213 [Orobanche minor]